MISLFMIGSSMAALQVAINPLLRVAGGEEHFAFNSAFAQLIFGIASFLSPQLYLYDSQPGGVVPKSGILFLSAMAPDRAADDAMDFDVLDFCDRDRRHPAGPGRSSASRRSSARARKPRRHVAGCIAALLQKPHRLLYFVSVFAYVGSSKARPTGSPSSSHLPRFDPHTTGAMEVAWFWGLLTIGCALGLVLLKLLDSRKVLIGASFGALAASPRSLRQ